MNKQTSSQTLRCGIVGYGYMGEIRRLVVDRHPQLELVGICESDARKTASIKGTTVFKDFATLLKQDIDIVFVCTPNKFSPQLCIESLKAGKHVFCEKPPGRNLTDIKNIRKYERPETKLMFGFNHRFHPGIIKAKVILESGRLGNIISLRGIYGKSGGVKFPESWRNNREISGGGILLDQGIHMLDLFRYFCGDFEQVKCFAGCRFWKFDQLEDNAYVMLENSNGQNAMCHSSATLWKHTFRLDIILEEGYMIVEGLLSKSGSYGRECLTVAKRQFENETYAVGNPSEEVTYFDRDESWDMEVDNLVQCIVQEKPVTVSSSYDALKVMEIIAKAYTDAGLPEMEGTYEEHCRI